MTVSAMVFGDAPGYWPETTTVGGTISGYSLIGRMGSAIRPATTTMMEITDAKIGRSMKKEDMFMRAARSSAAAAGRHLPGYGLDLHARAHSLQAADHDLFPRLQPLADHAQPVDVAAQLHRAVLQRVFVPDDQHEALALIGADRAIVDEHGVVLGAAEQLHASKQTRREASLLVVQDGA